MFERLDAIEKKYHELQNDLTNPEIISDYNKLKTLSKEARDLEETVKVYEEYKATHTKMEDAKALLKDEELKDLATLEYEENKEKLEKLTHELEILLVPKDENDGKNVIMEIRGAAGGDEANIFAGDLYRMYTYYAEKNNSLLIHPRPVLFSLGAFIIPFSVHNFSSYSS